ncbi:MAG: hypothetical protein IPL54_01455 [Chitinophagaceae bacterium]|nr:hypothetical protein [Chitinophagaceae bacterium]
MLYFPVPLMNKNSGIAKKCLGIIDAFNSKYDVDVMSECNGEVFFNQKKIKDYSSTLNKMRFYYYNDIFLGQFSLFGKQVRSNKYDVVYVRIHYFVTFGLLRFLKKIKRANNSVRIYIEIPTFPFDKELKSKVYRFRNQVNRITIPLLKKYVTKIVTLSTHDIIWEIPTVRISNGFLPAVTDKGLVRHQPNVPDNEFHIAMIAQFNDWHAADILVKSLKAYTLTSGPVRIKIHFIGKMIGKVTEMVKQENLQHDVIFHEEMDANEIAAFLNNIHVCVGTLGHHRKNIQLDSSLKNREYAFSGMPMILKTPDLDFKENLFFVKYFPDDETLLDLAQVLNFFGKLKTEHPDYKTEIIEYAKENLSWKIKLKEVLEAS